MAVCVTAPFVEMGVNDDFSYTQIALHLAQSGKFVYNGWNTPMIGLQAYWAASLIKIFGFSFTLVRSSTLPFLAGSALLLYYLARQAGLMPPLAALLTCFVTLSPLAVPLAASFMTDIPALFFLLLCMACALNALTAQSTAQLLFWAFGTELAGLFGGTIRQIVWVAPVVFLPYIALRGRSYKTGAVVATFWIMSLAGAVFFARWFQSQPYTVALPFVPSDRVSGWVILSNIAGLHFEFLVLFLPVLAFGAPFLKRLSFAGTLAISTGAAIGSAVLLAAPRLSSHLPDIPFGYFGGNVFTKYGVLMPGVEVMGSKFPTIPLLLQFVLLALAIGLEFAYLVALFSTTRTALAATTSNDIRNWIFERLPNENSPAELIQYLCLLFTVPYLMAVISRCVVGQGIDRYLLPLLVVGSLVVLPRLTKSEEFWVWTSRTAVALFALYAIATTHDYLACSRARLQAAQLLQNAHVARDQVTAGLEYDGWTEITRRGYINDSRITNPPGAYVPPHPLSAAWKQPYWFSQFTPSVIPSYYVVLSELPNLSASEFPPVPYRAWLPPFNRHVLIQVSSPGGLGQRTISSTSNRAAHNLYGVAPL